MSRNTHVHYHTRKPYRVSNFLIDCLMVMLTGGFWLIWVFCRGTFK